MAKAIWSGEVLAESDRGVLVEGNIYFPPDSVNREFLQDSERQYTCPWKGQAGYYDVVVKGKVFSGQAPPFMPNDRDDIMFTSKDLD